MAEAPDPTAGRVTVRRTGGFIGRAVEGSLDLDGPDLAGSDLAGSDLADSDQRVAEVRRLVAGLDLAAAPAGRAYPDMYTFAFDIDGVVATVPEHLLTPTLRRLAALVLPDLSG